jgi:hypothetical protein
MSDTSPSPKIEMSAELAVVFWRALREEDRSEADLLASVIIGNGFEPVFEDQVETVDFYREWLITEGFLFEVPDNVN